MGNAIGVIGGVGPYAGIDLVKKVFDNTIASSDQEHIDLYLTSTPALIGDRTAYLLEGGENPAAGLFSCLDKLALIGGDVIVIPCNTAHAPPIYDEVARRAAKKWPNVLLLNMIAETMKVIKERFPKGAKIGLLATLGTHGVGVYRTHFEGASAFTLIEPDQSGREAVHQAIYDRQYGIKAVAPPSTLARAVVKAQAKQLIERGADAIILGCTELPLALHDGEVAVPLLDPTAIVARAAIRAVSPSQLRNATVL